MGPWSAFSTLAPRRERLKGNGNQTSHQTPTQKTMISYDSENQVATFKTALRDLAHLPYTVGRLDQGGLGCL